MTDGQRAFDLHFAVKHGRGLGAPPDERRSLKQETESCPNRNGLSSFTASVASRRPPQDFPSSAGTLGRAARLIIQAVGATRWQPCAISSPTNRKETK